MLPPPAPTSGRASGATLAGEAGAGAGPPEAALPANLEVVGDVGPAVSNDPRLGRRSPHVEGDDGGATQQPTDEACGGAAGAAARLHGVDRTTRRLSGGHHAA